MSLASLYRQTGSSGFNVEFNFQSEDDLIDLIDTYLVGYFYLDDHENVVWQLFDEYRSETNEELSACMEAAMAKECQIATSLRDIARTLKAVQSRAVQSVATSEAKLYGHINMHLSKQFKMCGRNVLVSIQLANKRMKEHKCAENFLASFIADVCFIEPCQMEELWKILVLLDDADLKRILGDNVKCFDNFVRQRVNGVNLQGTRIRVTRGSEVCVNDRRSESCATKRELPVEDGDTWCSASDVSGACQNVQSSVDFGLHEANGSFHSRDRSGPVRCHERTDNVTTGQSSSSDETPRSSGYAFFHAQTSIQGTSGVPLPPSSLNLAELVANSSYNVFDYLDFGAILDDELDVAFGYS